MVTLSLLYVEKPWTWWELKSSRKRRRNEHRLIIHLVNEEW